MRNQVKVLAAALVLLSAAAVSAQTPAEDVAAALEGELSANVLEGCENELAEHCSAVTPGERRVLACLYAHGDKLSQQCELAVYESAVRLERAINAISYVASSCRSELQSFCAGVEAGDGRIAQCLRDHADELTPVCSTALSEVGVE